MTSRRDPARPLRRALVLLLVTLAVVAAACGDSDDVVVGDDTTTTGSDDGADDDTTTTEGVSTTSDEAAGGGDSAGDDSPAEDAPPVFAVLVGGGFVPVEMAMAEAPQLVILADGTVYRPGIVTAIFPGPALPALESTTLTADEVDGLLAMIADHGDLFGADYGQPMVTDVPSTTVTATLDGEAAEAQAYALDFEDDSGLTPEQVAARAELTALIADVQAVVQDPGRDWAIVDAPALEIRSMEPVADPGVDPGPPRDFPLEDVESLVPGESGFGCLAVEGDDLAVVLDAAADATQITPWIVGDATVQLVFSPLYPYETGCS